MLTWASSFVADQVDSKLSMQSITMPEGPALEGLPAGDRKVLEEFAGSPMDTGPEARAYADHFILAHMNASGIELAGKPVTYAEASDMGRSLTAAVNENPNASEADKTEAQAWMDLRASLFMGDTLRGLLLYGYAFATMGTIAGFAALGAFLGGGLLLILAALGFIHGSRTKKREGELAI